MTDEIQDRIVRIIADQAMIDPGEIRPETTMEDLGLDSLGLVEVVFAIEEAFDISVPYNANEPNDSEFDISSVAAVTAAVKQLIAAKG